MRDKFRTGLVGRKIINKKMRELGQEPAPGKDGGVKRFARWLARVQFAQTAKPTFERAMRYLNRGTRERYAAMLEHEFEQMVTERG